MLYVRVIVIGPLLLHFQPYVFRLARIYRVWLAKGQEKCYL